MTAVSPRPAVDAATARTLQRRATVAAVAIAGLMALAKLGAWYVTGAVTVLSSMVDSAVDVLASLVVLLAARHAVRPPDRQHRYGHGKAEALGALARSGFLGAAGLFVGLEGMDRLITPHPLQQPAIGIAVMALSIVLTAGLVVYQTYVLRRAPSLAIEADSANFKGDLVSATAVLVTLIVSAEAGIAWIDPAVGLCIAAYLIWAAASVGRRSIDMLMDRELPSADRARIVSIVQAHRDVHGLHDLRSRSTGNEQFIEFHMEIDGGLSVAEAHDITDAVEQALRAEYPRAEILIHQEPAGIDDSRLDDVVAGRPAAEQD